MRRMKIACLVTAIFFLGFVSASDAQTNVVTVTLSSYAFQPSALTLKAGEPVTLHLVNSAQKSHDFAAPDFFAAAAVATPDQAKVAEGRVDLDAGASADITLTPKAGTYSLTCSHFLHSMLGMTGTIVVK
jgi:uncharacterized cupredoxin-like copper-binding protein